MEVAEREQDSLELVGFGGLVNGGLVENSVASSDVGLQVLRSLIGDLD